MAAHVNHVPVFGNRSTTTPPPLVCNSTLTPHPSLPARTYVHHHLAGGHGCDLQAGVMTLAGTLLERLLSSGNDVSVVRDCAAYMQVCVVVVCVGRGALGVGAQRWQAIHADGGQGALQCQVPAQQGTASARCCPGYRLS